LYCCCLNFFSFFRDKTKKRKRKKKIYDNRNVKENGQITQIKITSNRNGREKIIKQREEFKEEKGEIFFLK